MDTRTGKIVDFEEIPENEKEHFIEIKRDLSALEEYQRQIELYAPCGCGSGNKFKFCCKK